MSGWKAQTSFDPRGPYALPGLTSPSSFPGPPISAHENNMHVVQTAQTARGSTDWLTFQREATQILNFSSTNTSADQQTTPYMQQQQAPQPGQSACFNSNQQPATTEVKVISIDNIAPPGIAMSDEDRAAVSRSIDIINAAISNRTFTNSQQPQQQPEHHQNLSQQPTNLTVASAATAEQQLPGVDPIADHVVQAVQCVDIDVNKMTTKSKTRLTMQCSMCQKWFRDKHGLSRHEKTHTRSINVLAGAASSATDKDLKERARPFKCETCGKAYTSRWDLNRHQKRHGERHHKCDRCEKAYFDKSHLKSHMMGHTNYRPLRCYVCEKGFIRNYELKRHIRSHTKIRPYPCDLCDKSFIDRSHLKAHHNVHIGYKPFSCERCDKKFARRYEITRHMKSHLLLSEKQEQAKNTLEQQQTQHEQLPVKQAEQKQQQSSRNVPQQSGQQQQQQSSRHVPHQSGQQQQQQSSRHVPHQLGQQQQQQSSRNVPQESGQQQQQSSRHVSQQLGQQQHQQSSRNVSQQLGQQQQQQQQQSSRHVSHDPAQQQQKLPN